MNNPCEVVSIRKHGESYYIRDLETNRIYLRNRKYIKHSESSRNTEHLLENMEVIFDKNVKHQLDNCQQEPDRWNLSTSAVTPPASCVRRSDSNDPNKRVNFDSSLFAARAELKRYRMSTSTS